MKIFKQRKDRIYILTCFSKNICMEIVAHSRQQATELFKIKHNITPNAICGPYRRSKECKVIAPTSFSPVKKAKYKGWNVRVFETNSDKALLIFDSKYLDSAIDKPTKPITVDKKDLTYEG